MMAEVGGGALTDCDHIISEILARLPVKSLMRFRCVSKPWRALINDPFFAKKHFRYAETHDVSSTSKLLFSLNPPKSLDYEALKNLDGHVGGQLATVELEFPVRNPDHSIPSNTVIFGSCNGLVCVFVKDTGIVLWNPCTRDHIVLPSPPICYDHMAFYGFGYDRTSDDYKIVYGITPVGNPWMGSGAEIHLFALKTGSWRTICNRKPDRAFNGQGKLLNGALHWVDQLRRPRVIACFDLGEEKFGEIAPLFHSNDYSTYLYSNISVYRNCLCVLQMKTRNWKVWIMKEYGVKESWTQVTEFSTHEILAPLCILENDTVLMHNFVLKERLQAHCLSSLVLANKNASKTVVFEACLSNGVTIYRETLVSPLTTSITSIQ